jgi:hypothetical protein
VFPLFATSVVDIGGKFAAGVIDTGGAPIPKKFEMTLMLLSEAWGNDSRKKPEQKIS